MSSGSKVMVLVGTRKGGFIFTSDRERKKWATSEILFKGWNLMHMNMDPRDGRLHAAVDHFVLWRHHTVLGRPGADLDAGDSGASHIQTIEIRSPGRHGRGGLFRASHSPDTPEEVIKVWNITPGRADEPGVLYAGVQPATLFKSTDRGESWALNREPVRSPAARPVEPGGGWAVPAHHRARPAR